MFYVVEKRDVSPHSTFHKVEILPQPEKTNLSREERIEGWCGTTNDVSVYAHGAYTSLKNARQAIRAKFRQIRKIESDQAIEAYKING